MTHDDEAAPTDRGREHDGDVSDLERTLTERGEPYARVTVVRREPPVSANVGDRAVVTADGELRGWIGGASCARSIAITEARAVLETGEPKLVGIAPDPDTVDRPGLEAHPMTCHSEGVLELFVEPVNAAPGLLVVGDTPVARSLARLAGELSLDVTLAARTTPDDLPADTTVVETTDPVELAAAVGPSPLVVVASMGASDARGVAAGVLADAAYVGLVASDARAAEVVDRAADLAGTEPEQVRAAVTTPAGVDIAAYTPAEIAVSLLAEVVDARSRAGAAAAVGDDAGAAAADTAAADIEHGDDEPATDPVCGMDVVPSQAAATVEHAGATYHFCCEGCAASFADDPAAYLADGEATP
jgi:xanthine dehydrogenase accessory factor